MDNNEAFRKSIAEKLKKQEPIFIEWDDKLIAVNPKMKSASYIDEDGLEKPLALGSEILTMAMGGGKEISLKQYANASNKAIDLALIKAKKDGVDTSFKEEDLQ